MLTYSEARERILDYLNQFDNPLAITIAILDGSTQDYKWCFVFEYESKEYIERNDEIWKLMGKSPLLISKKTGEIIELDNVPSIAEQVSELEKKGYGKP